MTTKTTFHLSLSRRAQLRMWMAQRDASTLIAPLALALLCLLIGIGLARQLVRPVERAASAPPAILIIATARAQALPTPFPTAAPRLVVAYDQPNGAAFPDPIPLPDPAQWIGRWGDTWIEVAWTPNPVWIMSADLGAHLADVRPVPTAPVAASAPPSYQGASDPPAAGDDTPAYQVSNQPQPGSDQRVVAPQPFVTPAAGELRPWYVDAELLLEESERKESR